MVGVQPMDHHCTSLHGDVARCVVKHPKVKYCRGQGRDWQPTIFGGSTGVQQLDGQSILKSRLKAEKAEKNGAFIKLWSLYLLRYYMIVNPLDKRKKTSCGAFFGLHFRGDDFMDPVGIPCHCSEHLSAAHLVVVATQHDANNVFADVVHVALHSGLGCQ